MLFEFSSRSFLGLFCGDGDSSFVVGINNLTTYLRYLISTEVATIPDLPVVEANPTCLDPCISLVMRKDPHVEAGTLGRPVIVSCRAEIQ